MPAPYRLACGTSCMCAADRIPGPARSFPYEVPTSHSRMRVSSPAQYSRATGCGRSSAQSRAVDASRVYRTGHVGLLGYARPPSSTHNWEIVATVDMSSMLRAIFCTQLGNRPVFLRLGPKEGTFHHVPYSSHNPKTAIFQRFGICGPEWPASASAPTGRYTRFLPVVASRGVYVVTSRSPCGKRKWRNSNDL